MPFFYFRRVEQELETYFDRLWPICRSITGQGLRDSFQILQEIIPLTLVEVPTGKAVLDWEIPDEWNITEAKLVDPQGQVVCDFSQNNLHVVNYSEPADLHLTFDELRPHLHSLPSQPEVIPYITSYYKRTWGFCLSHNVLETLPREGRYHVLIRSTLKPGSLTYGHLVLRGTSDREILLSSYLCHPSLANNELSGPLALAFLYRLLADLPKLRYTYRFVIAPETIGVLAYLAEHGNEMKKKTDAGFVLTCCGDRGPFHYKRSKYSNSLADRAAEHVLKYTQPEHEVREFSVGGSDERQYCSPGFNLPVGSLMRSVYHEYSEYHTSADNKAFLSFSHLAETIRTYFEILCTLEINENYKGRVQLGEPRLSRYDLYPFHVSRETPREELLRLLHLLSFADGQTDLITIADRFGCLASEFLPSIHKCREKGLLD